MAENDGVVDEQSNARWYIVHTYSGFENRVELTLREMMRTGQDGGSIKEVVVPTEKIIELVKGEKKTSTRKFYPGYVMVKMAMDDNSWHLVQSIPRVTGFIGGKNQPTPMRDSEAQKRPSKAAAIGGRITNGSSDVGRQGSEGRHGSKRKQDARDFFQHGFSFEGIPATGRGGFSETEE